MGDSRSWLQDPQLLGISGLALVIDLGLVAGLLLSTVSNCDSETIAVSSVVRLVQPLNSVTTATRLYPNEGLP